MSSAAVAARPASQLLPTPLAGAWLPVLGQVAQGGGDGQDAVANDRVSRLLASLRDEPRFDWLRDTFELDDLQAACVAVCMAFELDPGLSRARAQPGPAVSSGRPDGLFLQRMLCTSLDQSLALQASLTWDSPLFRHRLLQPVEPEHRVADVLRHAPLVVDPQIARTLAYGDWLDPRLARYCRMYSAPPEERPAAIDMEPLARLMVSAQAHREPLLLAFQGQPGSGRQATARHLAAKAGVRLIVADLAHAGQLGEFAELTGPLLREAWLQDAWLYLEGVEGVLDSAPAELQRFLDDLADDSGITLVGCGQVPPFGGRKPLAPLVIEFDGLASLPTWRDALDGDVALSDADLESLSSRYPLPMARIRAVALHASRRARLQRGPGASVSLPDMVGAARQQGPSGLSGLARKIVPVHRWEQLVLPEDALRQMREICARVEFAGRVFGDWGFAPRMSLGKGTAALFAGASGTGKTMAAEVIASDLGMDLYKIDLATVVSKYIGETEKNLDRVFTAARYAHAVLLFDEADSLFGKRSEVHDARDRYANLEVSYLLQRMEEYEGLSILSTNLRQNLDEAFLRRLTYTVLFPFPTAADRETIWRKTCPSVLPLADDVDFSALARQFKLPGGSIRNAVLAAAFFAAADRAPVGMRHLVHAIRRELQKSGKNVGDIDPVTLQTVSTGPEARLGHG